MTKHVLILDDNADNRQLLYFALMAGDYEIYQAEQGSDVVALMENTSFDMALLDIELPDADGLELAEKLKAQCPDVTLIMLSANDNTDRLEKARQVGAEAYVVKPFNLPKVLDFIREFEHKTGRPASGMQVIVNTR
jgi:DNA-binding response OmpR family regulator